MSTVETSSQKFGDMNDIELTAAVHAIVVSSSSEDEIRRRLIAELAYPYHPSISILRPATDVARAAMSLRRQLGGLVMEDGTAVMMTFWGHDPSPITI